jgi:bifunctional aspartokinase / homoserine dehydrogenase 1
MLVMKFGGTSVGSAGRMAAVADIVKASGDQPVVVVASAMSGVTNQLIAAARAAAEGQDSVYRDIKADLVERHLRVINQLLEDSSERLDLAGLIEDRLYDFERLCRSIAVLGELTNRGSDAVASIGEHLSCPILAAVLRKRGTRAEMVSSTELVVTDANYGGAAPDMVATGEKVRARLMPLLERGLVPVVTGYVGATVTGVTTTLGRGGSDYSAAILGAGLHADQVWIWTDVDGILTADPKIVPGARSLDELSYDEAAALAYFGADVLHPKTIRPVVEQGIPLRICNSFLPEHPGTMIVERPSPTRPAVGAIISTKELSLIALAGDIEHWSPQIAARALRRLGEAGVEVLMFSQSFSQSSLNVVVRAQDQEHCLRVLEREFEPDVQLGTVSTIGQQAQVAAVSVVGEPDGEGNSIIPRAFAALGQQGTRVISVTQASSEYNVTFAIPEEDVDNVVRFIHHELALGANGREA